MKERDAAAVTVAIDSGRDPRGRGMARTASASTTPGADHIHHLLGHRRLGHRPARPRRAAAPPGGEPRRERDRGGRSLERALPTLRGRTVTLYVVTGLADAQAGRTSRCRSGKPRATAPRGRAAGLDRRVRRRLRPEGGVDPRGRQPLGRGAPVAGAGPARPSRPRARRCDLSDLEGGVSDPYAPAPGRFYNRIFRSDPGLRRGHRAQEPPGSPGGSPEPQFLSPHQPYGLYLPDDYDPGRPPRCCSTATRST